MKTVQDLLRDADPLGREPLPSADERERTRRVVLAASGNPAPTVFGRRVAIAAGAALFVTVAAGARLWSGNVVHAAVRFEVRLAESTFSPGLTEAHVVGSPRVVYLHQDVVVTNEDILTSRVTTSSSERFNVAVTFNTAGAAKMAKATADHLGRPAAILIDGRVIAAPTVRSVIGGEALITGDFTRAEADRIAEGMMIR